MVRIDQKDTKATPEETDYFPLLDYADLSGGNPKVKRVSILALLTMTLASTPFASAILAWWMAKYGIYSVKNYGATGDGSTDDTAAFQAWATALNSSPGARGYGAHGHIPPGTYKLTDTVIFHNLQGVGVGGAARGQVKLAWAGPDDRAMFRITNCRECTFHDFRVSPTAFLLVGLSQYRLTSSGSIWSPTFNRYENIQVDGTAGGSASLIGSAFQSGGQASYINANNDFTLYVNCNATNYRDQAWWFDGSQNYYNKLIHCRANGAGGNYGVYSNLRSHFQWDGGGVFGHAQADFKIVTANNYATYRIANLTGENSARFVDAADVYGINLVIEGVRWAGDQVNADGKFIKLATYGLVAIRNCVWMERHATNKLHVEWQSIAATTAVGAKLVYELNTWYQNSTTRPSAPEQDSTFFSIQRPTAMRDNKVFNESTFIASEQAAHGARLTNNAVTPYISFGGGRGGEDFNVANTGPTTVTNLVGGAEGMVVRLYFTNANTTIQHNANIILAGAVDFGGTANDTLTLRHNGTAWVEQYRAVI